MFRLLELKDGFVALLPLERLDRLLFPVENQLLLEVSTHLKQTTFNFFHPRH
jgi:hypothetical protein